MTKDDLVLCARKAAVRHNVPPEIVCGIVTRESSWNPWTVRYEPQFFLKYVAPLYIAKQFTATEAYGRGMSWGLMQVMGETAREKGFTGEFLSELCDPEVGLEWGCLDFAHMMAISGGSVNAALEKYNGGANPNYAAEVVAFAGEYRSDPASV